ncbi:hypothetical protein, partial [Nostoc sp. FACHB-145]|uniref:hypothetical protein n=1 Tax=Nostoc sp. FACHB-145 TaxID=2692836 RepID=UPI001688BF6B|nr:hypothetical protein [Nostoc sp. FACHB-145]
AQALLSNWGLEEGAEANGTFGEPTEEILTLPVQKTINGIHSEASKTKPEVVANRTELPKVNKITTAGISSPNQVTQGEENLSNGRLPDVAPNETESDETANVESPPAINALVAAKGESDTFDETSDTQQTAPELAPNSTVEISPQASELPVAEPTKQEKTTTAPDKSLYGQDVPMLGEYQSLRRIEAVEKLLQQYKGSVCHIDFVVRSLYGELEPKAWKVVKGRVQSTLTQGREQGKWSLVPGKPGYYTIDLKLLNSKRKDSSSTKNQSKNEKPAPQAQTNISAESSSVSSQTQTKKTDPQAKVNVSKDVSTETSQTQKRKPSPQAKANVIPMKGEFEGKFLIDAISLLLEKNPRKVFDSGEVIERLYGKLSVEQVKQVKPAVLNELSRGFRTGRFSKVPDEKGLYIWDSKLLPA